METFDLLAKVLANENLTVRKTKIKTACFDLVNRELMLPMWDNLDPVVETMLVEHETGHALFTPVQYKDEVQARPYMSTILNVVEDARIERLFKEKYPGSRKDFAAAARVLRETDFFEIDGADVNSFNLIDRINLYCKLGVLTGVKFSKDELPFVMRNASTVTFPEVVTLANDIYAFMLTKEMQKQEEADKSDSEGDTERGDGTPADDEEGESTSGDPSDGEANHDDDDDGDPDEYSDGSFDFEEQQRDIEAALTSKTDELYNSKLGDHAGVGEAPRYVTLDEDYPSFNVVGYKEVLTTVSKRVGSPSRDPVEKFKRTVTKQVGHLVQQFELKKAAEVYARRRITKTGFIDTNKISQYQIKDDIFRRSIKVKEGQNHGIVMLLDWSRSMVTGGTIYHSIDQIMQMVMFCRSVGVPYRVFAFTDHYDYDYSNIDRNRNHRGESVKLLEFFSNEMTLTQHNEMMAYMSQGSVMSTYRLHYTPLAPAILMMRKIIPEFKAKYRVDKLNFMTFTDGGNTTSIISGGSDKTIYVTDSVLKKSFLVRREKNESVQINEVNAFYRIIKERFDCTVTTFFVTPGRNLNEALRYSGTGNEAGALAITHKAEFARCGFFMIKGWGRDAIYIVNSSIMRTSEFSLHGISENMTASAIARQLKSTSKSSLKNKILIEKLSDTLC